MVSVLKIDVDVKENEALLERFIISRLWILEKLGYTPIGHNVKETTNGYHLWFEVEEELTDNESCDLQFLLGDDQKRCRFNYMRNEAGVFKTFNALFNKKLKRNGKGNWVESEDLKAVRAFCPFYPCPKASKRNCGQCMRYYFKWEKGGEMKNDMGEM